MSQPKSEPRSEPKRFRSIVSFVIRQGRHSLAQTRAINQHWAAYGLTCPSEKAPLDWDQVFNGQQSPIVLEIGFGMGHSLLTQALQSPDKRFIGIEVHPPGIGTLLKGIASHNINNIRVFQHNAVEALQNAVPDNSLDCVQLFFPDPWPKKRHHKRRLVQTEFVNLLAQKLVPQGVLHLATDWVEYAEHMHAVLQANPYFTQASPSKLAELIQYRPKTKFENKGLRLGHVISDIAYIKL